MRRWRKLLLIFFLLAVVFVLLPAGAFYWRAHRALPAYDGEVQLEGLSQPVRIARDAYGVPHIYAETLEDLVFAQGYVHAQERLWQMDMLRRTARGQLSEVIGPVALELDKENRTLGLGRVADRTFGQMPEEERRLLQAYARGVNAYRDSRDGAPLTSALPLEFALLRYRPEPWQPADTLAVGLNMFKLLTNRWRSELARLQVEDMLTEDLAADLFVSQSEYDHPIAKPQPRRGRPRIRRTVVAKNCRHSLEEILGTAPHSINSSEFVGASNNWVVSGQHTASGQAMLANDMHLPHTVPAVWFMNHLTAPDLDVTGFSLPGLPFVMVGHNQDIAWGFTNLGADVQDLYVETFDPDDPSRYLTPQGWQTVTQRRETIKVRGEDDVELEVLETRHGPIIHDDGELKLALQWTAHDAGKLAISPAFLRVNRASNWQEFTAAMASYGGPAQNAVYADREGHIGYHAIGRIPRRRTGLGYLPMPGDSPDFDWVGYVPFEQMPQNFDPPEGVLATANNRVVPRGFPIHITDRWMNPSRIHRINLALTDLIDKGLKIAPLDMIRLQGDTISLPNLAVAKHLLAAAKSVDSHPAQRQQALKELLDWDGQMDAGALAPVIADMARRRLLRDLLEPKLGEDWRSYNWWMAPVFLENVLRNRPAGWLPLDQPGYDEFLLGSLDRALENILSQTRAPSLDRLRWGDQMQLRMTHPVGDRLPILRRWFSRSGRPQSGGRYTVKQTGRGFGPSERMVVDFGNLDASLLNTTLGQSGHLLSPHYADQFPAWYEVIGLASPFTKEAVAQATQHTLYLRPQ